VSWGRRSWSSLGAPNHSEGDRPSVVGAPDAVVADVLGVARCPMCASLNADLDE
jgi:hypothetical protein